MNALQTFIAKLPFGFITSAQMPELIALDRLHPCLIRCGNCRVTTPAQDVEHVIKCIAVGGDYVRDVSLPVGSMERAANWQPKCSVREDFRTGQFIPQVNGVDVSPTSFDKERAFDIAQQTAQRRDTGTRDCDDTISEPNTGL